MKNVLAIFLISIYVFSATELHQLLKLPVLLEHFEEHQKKDNSISMFKFLAMHYLYSDDKDGDKDKDVKLPFKSNDECANSINIAFTQNPNIIIQKLIVSVYKTFELRNDSFIPTSILSSIWQPPRI